MDDNLPIRGRGILTNPLKIESIPEEKYLNPIDLFDYTFGDFFFKSVFDSTSAYITDHPQLAHPTIKPSIKDIRAFFGYSMIMNDWKPPKMDYQPFLSQLCKSPSDLKVLMGYNWKCPLEVPSEIYHFPYKRYDYISKVLDLGPNFKVPKLDSKGNPKLKSNGEPVLVWDLRLKFEDFEKNSNALFRKFKYPTDNILCFDETLRASFSVKDQLKTYMPAKSPPYGQKSFSLCDKDLYCHSFTTALPSQFSFWEGSLEELFYYCYPKEYLNRGFGVTADNYFYTISLIERLAKNHTSVTATMRQNRLGKAFADKNLFKNIVEKQKNNHFRRKIDVYQSIFLVEVENKFQRVQSWEYPIQLCVYHDKKSKNPVLFLCSDPGLMGGFSKSEPLTGKNKPPISELYDSTMFYTDKMDQNLRKFTSSRRCGRWTNRYITGRFDVFMNNAYVLFKIYVNKNLPKDSNLVKMSDQGALHTYFQTKVALGLISNHSETVNRETVTSEDITYDIYTDSPNSESHFIPCTDLTKKKRKNCQFGKSHDQTKGYRSVRTTCIGCHEHTCLEHMTYVCKNCICITKSD